MSSELFVIQVYVASEGGCDTHLLRICGPHRGRDLPHDVPGQRTYRGGGGVQGGEGVREGWEKV